MCCHYDILEPLLSGTNTHQIGPSLVPSRHGESVSELPLLENLLSFQNVNISGLREVQKSLSEFPKNGIKCEGVSVIHGHPYRWQAHLTLRSLANVKLKITSS